MPTQFQTTLQYLACLLTAALLCSCVYLPVVDQQHMKSTSCKTVSKKLTLSADNDMSKAFLNGSHCHDTNCALVELSLAAVVPAGSAIVSGCIVLLNNTVYWLEYTGTCEEKKLERAKTDFYQSLD